MPAEENTDSAKNNKSDSHESENKRPSTLDVNYSSIESAGLYSKAKNGSLGKDLWDGAQRSYLTTFLEKLPEASSRTLRALNKRALLTTTNSRLINNDIEIRPGRDILTIRINKLMELGLYAQAFELYALLNDEVYHEKLARAGILSMLYNGEKSLACLEGNTIIDRFSDKTFWQEFQAYCAYSLSNKPGKAAKKVLKSSKKKILQKAVREKKYRFSYAPVPFNGLSQLEQGILVAEEKLSLNNLKTIKFSEIPTTHLSLLLNHKKLTAQQRMLLTIQAVDRNIVEIEDLKKLYEITFEPAAGKKSTKKDTKKAKKSKDKKDKNTGDLLENASSAAPKNWQALPYYYQQATNTDKDEDQWQIIRNVLKLKNKYGIAALTPFAEMIHALKPAAPTLTEIGHALRTMHAAELSIPENWIKSLGQLKNTEEPYSNEYKYLYSAAFLAQTEYKRKDSQRQVIAGFFDGNHDPQTVFLRNIIENLDKSTKDVDNAPEAYEKDFDLTSTGDYVMPSVDVWDRLVTVSQNRNIGETILLSTFVLQGARLEDFYPGVLRDVLNSFNTVGLTNVSRKMAVEALLER